MRCHSLVVVALIASIATPLFSATKPNLLLIIADDCTYRDLEVYGGQAKTPNLNRLAAAGLTFSRCFQAAPMCSPTRHCLYTGIYPVKSGAYPNHTFVNDGVGSIAIYLKDAGYRVALSGKTHINPPEAFPFEYSKKNNNPDEEKIDRFLKDHAGNDMPFALLACSNEPHSPWNKGDRSQYPPAQLQLPPIYVDAPVTREGFSRYLAEITYFDGQVGRIVGMLDKHGLGNNTLVIVLSEQGNSFPFAKWTCYDAGLQSGMIARWPGVIEAGSKTDAMVEYVDIVPTLLEAAGLPRPQVLDGRSFLAVLKAQTNEHKHFVYGLHTTRGIINGSDHYGVRSVRTGNYLYIRNLTPDVRFQNAATKNENFKQWEQMAADGNPRAKRIINRYRHRPAEELYDVVADPWNTRNLAKSAPLASIKTELRVKLDAWMQSQGDEGQATELAALDHQWKNRNKQQPAKPKRASKRR